MSQVLLNSTDVSGKITSISSISYRRNDPGTYELPELSIETTWDSANMGDTVTVKYSPSQSTVFYIDSIVYDYQSQLYKWECPHILSQLKSYYARDIALAWAGITPSYAQYNYQYDSSQGQSRWERRYWQVLFLLQTLIRKVTGLSISSIDITKITGNSPFYRRAVNEFEQWVTTPIQYALLGVSVESIWRLGSKTHADYASDDYDVYGNLPSALDVLNWLCAACGFYIDIFRTDYAISIYEEQPAPASAIQVGREDRALDQYRFYAGAASRLAAGANDYIYGTYDALDNLVPYTFGSSDADYDLAKQQYMTENTAVASRKSLVVTFPALFKLYSINNSSDYRSNIAYMFDNELGYDWLKMWIDAHTDYWLDRSVSRTYTIPLSSYTGGGRSVEIDVSLQSQTKKYEVLI